MRESRVTRRALTRVLERFGEMRDHAHVAHFEACVVCGKPTSERKPWCWDHLDLSTGAQRVAGLFGRMAREDAAAREGKATAEMIRARDAYELVAFEGPASPAQLARLVGIARKDDLDGATIGGYLAALERAELVSVVVWKRRGVRRTVVMLPESEADAR